MKQREIKFRYVYRHEETGEITTQEWDLRECCDEMGTAPPGCEIVARLQYTGLTDAEGTEVFEGDVIWATSYPGANRRNWQIEWSDEVYRGPRHVGVALDPFGDPKQVGLSELLEDHAACVIGNIYEQPDLLSA